MRISSLCFVLALAGCGKDKPKASEAPPPPPTPAPAATSSVQIFVDDAVVGTIALDQVKLWPRVDSLVPTSARHLGSWQDVYLHGKGPKPTELHQPTASYPDFVPALFPGDDGKPAFGLFDPIELSKHGKPAVGEQDVTEVRIKLSQGGSHGQNESNNAQIVDPKDLKITIKSHSGTVTLGGEKLMAVARENMPGTDEPKGWTLATVLKTAGIDKYEKLLLTDQGGLNLTLEKQDLDPKTSIPYIKLNRQGSLRVKIFKKQGDGWQGTGDLRGLVAIEILE
jgi:hypothetical protein